MVEALIPDIFEQHIFMPDIDMPPIPDFAQHDRIIVILPVGIFIPDFMQQIFMPGIIFSEDLLPDIIPRCFIIPLGIPTAGFTPGFGFIDVWFMLP